MKKLTSSFLAVLLIFASITQTGCGNEQTLARVGAVAVQLAAGFESEVAAIEAAGLIKDAAKLANLKQKAGALKTATKALNDYLLSLSSVNQNNKAEIARKIGEATSIVNGLLLNPDVVGLSDDATVVKVLKYASITLQQISLTIAALNPPAAGIASSGQSSGIPINKIKISVSQPPDEIAKYLNQ